LYIHQNEICIDTRNDLIGTCRNKRTMKKARERNWDALNQILYGFSELLPPLKAYSPENPVMPKTMLLCMIRMNTMRSYSDFIPIRDLDWDKIYSTIGFTEQLFST
jgi:hypothetical protein